MIRRRRSWITGIGFLVVLMLALVWKTGWFSSPRPWPEATGWSRIPDAQKGDRGEIWSASKGVEAPLLSWLGHSGFMVRWGGATVLLDPNVSSHCTVSRRVLDASPDLAEIGAVDAVLISHAHFDHLDLPSIRELTQLDQILVPAGAESYFDPERWTGTRVRALRPGEQAVVGDLEIVAVTAAHNGNRLHPLKSAKLALGYILRFGGEALYYAGDTGIRNDFTAIRDSYRPRAAILPIGAFSPRWPMRYYHLSPEEAVQVARELGVETVVPGHFGTFTLSWDRPDEALPRFARAASEADVRWVMPALLQSNEPRTASR